MSVLSWVGDAYPFLFPVFLEVAPRGEGGPAWPGSIWIWIHPARYGLSPWSWPCFTRAQVGCRGSGAGLFCWAGSCGLTRQLCEHSVTAVPEGQPPRFPHRREDTCAVMPAASTAALQRQVSVQSDFDFCARFLLVDVLVFIYFALLTAQLASGTLGGNPGSCLIFAVAEPEITTRSRAGLLAYGSWKTEQVLVWGLVPVSWRVSAYAGGAAVDA